MVSQMKLLQKKYKNKEDLKNKLINNTINEISSMSQEELEELVLYLNHLYYNDESLLGDSLYDVIKDYLEEHFPKSSILNEVGSIPKKNKVKLPFYMASMKKLKPNENNIQNWFKKYKGPYVVSDKLDGTSGMLYFKNNNVKMFTRGSHDYGRDISHLIPYLINIPTNNIQEKVNSFLSQKINSFAIRGEIILEKKKFEQYQKEGFKSGSRSIVNALVIKKEVDKKLATDSDFVLFEIVEPRLPKIQQFELLKYLGFKVSFNKKFDTLDKEKLSNILDDRRKNSIYDIDGIIVEDNGPHSLAKQTNPDYAFAYKQLYNENIFEVPVLKVEYEASKDGVLVPIVHYQPINYKGDILKKATGFNAKFIKENGIGPGAMIKVIRAGEIIPYIHEVVNKVKPQMPNVEYEWNESGVDALLKNASSDKTVKLKLLINFFTKLEFSFINRGLLEKFVNNDLDTIDKILNVQKEQLLNIEGFKEKMAEKIYNSINENFVNITPAALMSASNSFGKGFGERRIKQILQEYPNIVQCYKDINKEKLIEDINNIEGFQTKTSSKFVENLGNFCEFLEKNQLLKQVFYKKEKKEDNKKPKLTYSKLENINIVMSGFRDKDLVRLIEQHNGKVVDTISSKVNILVVKDKSNNSSKIQKATKLNIPIMDIEEFNKYYS